MSTRSDTPDFSIIAEHAMQQLDQMHEYARAVELQKQAKSRRLDPIHPAALGLTPVQASKSPASHSNGNVLKPEKLGDSTKEHLSRLTHPCRKHLRAATPGITAAL
jgi:hypothetical protein